MNLDVGKAIKERLFENGRQRVVQVQSNKHHSGWPIAEAVQHRKAFGGVEESGHEQQQRTEVELFSRCQVLFFVLSKVPSETPRRNHDSQIEENDAEVLASSQREELQSDDVVVEVSAERVGLQQSDQHHVEENKEEQLDQVSFGGDDLG